MIHIIHQSNLAMAFVAFAGLAGGSVANAQWRNCDKNRNYRQFRQREELRRHQQRERYIYGNSYGVRVHQHREREEFRRRQRIEQFRSLMNGNRRFNNGYGRYSDCRRRF